MNDAPDDRERLLAETLHGDWTGGPAGAMPRRAAAYARRRHAVRRASLALAAAATVAAVFLFVQRAHSPLTPSAPPVAVVPPSAHPGYEIISDDELVATLRDRPLLVLPQENGTKKIVLLDR